MSVNRSPFRSVHLPYCNEQVRLLLELSRGRSDGYAQNAESESEGTGSERVIIILLRTKASQNRLVKIQN